MKKRILFLILAVLLLASALPVSVSADSAEGLRICQRIEEHYAKTLEANETDSLSGYCGTLASYQLYYLGVNKYLVMANGNDQYDCYLNSNYTSNGYRIKRYPAEEYTLEEALYTITQWGKRNAYNILVGFHTTNTEAGALYGHAVVIYGIVEGKVYFTESFKTAYAEEEGMPSVCTISQFADMYNSWTTLEGVVVFGQKDYMDNCYRRDACMYVQVQRDDPLYTMPCVADSEEVDSQIVRMARKGEYLLVTAMYENTLGRYYYQVQDGDTVCYLDSQRAEAVRFNAEDVTIENAQIPQVLKQGKDFTVKGKLTSEHSLISAVTVAVTDSNSQAVMTHSLAKLGGTFDLNRDTFNSALDFSALEAGLYTYTVTAEVSSKYLADGIVETGTAQITLCNALFAVGEETQLPQQGRSAPAFIEDGWTLQDGVWRCYENGAPRTGWICIDGLDYYLKEDGTVTTGWAEINGKNRYFNASGAMCTGWLSTEEGNWYLLKNGRAAIGWRNIEDGRYCFDENGKALSGWQTVDGNDYYFADNGQLLAKAVEEEDTVSYELLVEAEIEIPPLAN